MELRMTVHVPHRRPRPVDVVVTAADDDVDAAALRVALGEHLGMRVDRLLVAGRRLADDAALGMPPLLDGVSVAATAGPDDEDTAAGGAGVHPRPVLRLVCTGGPDAGRAHPLEPPGFDVGRSPTRGLSLDDPSLSRAHVRVDVGPDGLHVTDLGSTNGVLVDGRRATGRTRVDTSSTLVAGASTLRIRRAPGPGLPVTARGDGTLVVVPGRPTDREPPDAVVEAPSPPVEPSRGRVPWVAALAPLPVVAAMALLLGPRLLVLAVLGPLGVLATTLVDRVSARRRRRRDVAAHRVALEAARRRFADAVTEESRLRHRRHPGPDEVLATAEHRLPGLWAGAGAGGGDRTVRLGLGTVPTTARWRADGRDRRGSAEHVPVVVDLDAVGALGVLAPPQEAGAVLAAALGQLLVRSPPSRLSLRLARADRTSVDDARGWLHRLPHVTGRGRPVLVVEDAARIPDVAAAVRATTEAGGVALVSGRRPEDLPDGCGAVLTPAGGGRWTVRTADGAVTVVADGVGPAWRDRLSRALAPLREDGADGSLPVRLALPDLHAHPLTPDAVRSRWGAATGPRAVVGATTAGPFAVDLRADGPHVLVGGTTGSGKSEFLRTLVTGLALDSPPEDLTMLLVDFKGGAAFGPCSGLPHVVGLVTDLDDVLADRVLRSLRAELRRRERVLADAGVTDLDAHRDLPGAQALPRLVVVVDELRTLVDELPDVVRELVRLAAQGRSLGIHLVLATQRPAGAVTPEVQANVNLRIAFRVRDRADAVGVVDDPRPADLPSDVPGRGVARGGDGRLTDFQVALVRPGRPVDAPRVTVRAALEDDAPGAAGREDRAADTAAVVDVVARAQASRGVRPPLRPWLPPLPDRVDAGTLPAGSVALADEPDAQRQVPVPFTPATPLWRVVGRPRSGRSSALAALVRAAVATHPPDRLHVHVLAATDEHRHLLGLPHVGTVARADDPVAVAALLEHLAAVTGPDAPRPVAGRTTLLVVDDWERLAEQDDPHAPRPASHELLRVLRDGAAAGLVAAVAGGRDLLRSSWSALGGEVLVLGEADPLDAALLGLPSGARPTATVPGRGLLAGDAREVQVLAPDGAWPEPSALPSSGPRPWRHRPLPPHVARHEVEDDDDDADAAPGLLLGLAGPTAASRTWRPDRDGRRLLVAGPPGSGRTSTLAVLARSAVDAGRPVVVVTADAAAPRSCRWPVPDGSLLGPADGEALVALRREHPDLVVLVDDADRVDGTDVAPVLAEIVGLVDRDDGAVVVATSVAGLRTRFRGLDVDVAAHRQAVLLRPGPHDAELLGVPRLAVSPAAPPGRGVLVTAGSVTPIQVLAPDRDGDLP